MSSNTTLPYSIKDLHYDNAKFRPRSLPQVISQTFFTKKVKREIMACSTGKFLVLLMICGLTYLMLTHASPINSLTSHVSSVVGSEGGDNKSIINGGIGIKRLLRRPPRLPPRLIPGEVNSSNKSIAKPDMESKWTARQESVQKAFIHAWSGYKNYAMGYDELMPLSKKGVNGLGGLGATIVDALDTAMIMTLDDVVYEAGSWIEKHLPGRILHKGEPKYSLEAMKVMEHMKTLPKVEGLVPIYISPSSGEFSGANIRLGSRGDSYYEYLIKVWLQQRQSNWTYLHDMYVEAMKGVKHLLINKSKPNGLVFVGELPYGVDGGFSPKMDHLVCFLPGTLALGATKGITKAKAMEENLLTFEDLENLKLAEDLAKTCFEMYAVTSSGLAPEIAYFNSEGYSEEGLDGGSKTSEYIHDIIIKHADRHNLLRPETVESLFILYRITEDSKYREWGWSIFEAFEKYAKVDSGGYSSLDDVTMLPPRRRDKMETFFLGETLKYLYLLFSDSNVIPLTEFVFNTEAHPIPIITKNKKE